MELPVVSALLDFPSTQKEIKLCNGEFHEFMNCLNQNQFVTDCDVW
jgi:hypothetical protein